MLARYPHKWASAFPTGDALKFGKAEWAERLGDLSGEEIKRGLDAWTGDWPPSVEEFRKACRPPKASQEGAQMYREFPRALPEPDEVKQARREKGKQALKGLRVTLKIMRDREDGE